MTPRTIAQRTLVYFRFNTNGALVPTDPSRMSMRVAGDRGRCYHPSNSTKGLTSIFWISSDDADAPAGNKFRNRTDLADGERRNYFYNDNRNYARAMEVLRRPNWDGINETSSGEAVVLGGEAAQV